MALPAPMEVTGSGTIQVGPPAWGQILKIEDPNGNFMTATSTGWTDTLGRAIPWQGGENPMLVLPGPYGGTSPFTVSGSQGSFTFPEEGPGPACTMPRQDFCFTSGYGNAVVQSVGLPNGTAYTFTYDARYGTLSQITLPTGGTISYTWTTSNACNGPAGIPGYPTYSLMVTSRTVNANDGTGPHTWNYTYTPAAGASFQTIVTDPLGNDTVHKMTALGQQVCANVYETEADKYAGTYTSGTLLATTVTNYTSSPDPYILANAEAYDYLGGLSGLAMNVVPQSVTTTDLASGKTSLVTKYYDSGIGISLNGNQPPTVNAIYGNLTQENDYDFGSTSGTPGSLLRTTNTAYMALSGPNAPAYLANNLLDLPYAVRVLDGSGVQASLTQYNYDEASPTTSGLGPSAQFDTAAPAGTYRGDNTSILRWLNSGSLNCPNGTIGGANAYIIGKMTYYDTGTPSTATDPCGNTTSYTYSPSYLDAFPTAITNALNQATTYSYDFNTGLKSSATDANLQTTSYAYDNSWRLNTVGYPDGGSTSYCYSDTSSSLCAGATTYPSVLVTDKLVPNTSEQVEIDVDGLGRKMTQQILSDQQGVDYTSTTYDSLGRVASISNPYRTLSDSTYGITSYAYDALGRRIYQCQPDNGNNSPCQPGSSYLQWSYAGNVTDSYDETRRHWQRTSDSLGRLTKVLEPDGSTNLTAAPTLETDYTYDVLGDLQTVTQNGQATETPRTRSFTYDSLGRLLTSQNPETGSISYTYDPTGNLIQKIAPAPNVKSGTATLGYCYDSLNRATYKFYSTPNCTNTGAAVASYAYDSTSLPGASNTVGRLTSESVLSGGAMLSQRSLFAYDPMGRLQGEQQCPIAPCPAPYAFNYTYDYAGNVISSGNGMPSASSPSLSAVALSYAYDSVGRLATLTNNANNPSPVSLLFQATPQASMPTTYGPVGIVNAQIGVTPVTQAVALGLSRGYDNRMRLVSETDNGFLQTTAATSSSGSIVVTGGEQVVYPSPTQSSGTITITGSEGSNLVCVKIWISLTHSYQNVCNSVPDTGTLSVTVGAFTSTASYASGSTDSSIAQALATGFANTQSPVTVTFNGPSLTLTSIATGPTTNYPIAFSNGADFSGSDSTSTLTGGSIGPGVYDAGSMTITIGPASAGVTWQQGDTASTVASNILSTIQNNPTFNFLTASIAGGTTVNVSSRQTGASTNWPISITSTDSNSSLFPLASFTASPTGMVGGGYAVDRNGVVYSYSIPSTGGYDHNGNLLNYTDSVMGAWSFGGSGVAGYDNLNRLVGAQGVSGAYQGVGAAWSYDSFGNRKGESFGGNSQELLPTSSTAQYSDGTNQVTSSSLMSGTPLGYDGAGNVTQDNRNVYLYDAENRVCAVQSLADGSMTGYLYDAEGSRTAKGTVASLNSCPAVSGFTSLKSQYLLGQGGEQVTELDGLGNWQHSNVYASGRLLATYDANGPHFQLSDWLGTRRAQTNAAGVLEETCASLPYGDNLTCSGPGYDATEQHFTGKERDTESGNDYFGARYYASSMGRWTSPDLVNVTEERMMNPSSTLNKYAYAANNPLKYVDPDGQDVTIFFERGNPLPGHTMLLAYNQNTGDSAIRSFGPDHSTASQWKTFFGIPVPGTDSFGFEDIHSADDLRANFASITIQTTPEEAQAVVNAIRTHPDGNYTTYWNNCTTTCSRLLRSIGKTRSHAPNPEAFFNDLFDQYVHSHPIGKAASATGRSFVPGSKYGNPRPGYDPFDLFFRDIPQPPPAPSGGSGGGGGGGKVPCDARAWFPC